MNLLEHLKASAQSERELHMLSAFVDDALPHAQRENALQRIACDRDAMRRVAAYRAQTLALKVLFAGSGAPRYLVVHAPALWRRRMGVAASCLIAGVAFGGISARDGNDQAAFAHRADIAYAVYVPDQLHPVEVQASDQGHLVNWLSERLNRTLTLPSLREYGYTLIGGRLLPDARGPAAQFMYEDAMGNRLTLYIATTSLELSAIESIRAGTRETFYWAAGRLNYALSGQMSNTRLRALADHICDAFGGKTYAWH
jgi:anti-sigma factor RsiW